MRLVAILESSLIPVPLQSLAGRQPRVSFFLMDLHNSPIPALTPLSLGPGGPLPCLGGLLGDAAL